MSAAPRQLVFELPHRSALAAEDFLVSRSNSAAVELVDAWPNWPHWAAVVQGPEGSGKSHLANVWRLKSDAALIAAAVFDDAALPVLQRHKALLVEDLHEGVRDQRSLFHALESRARAQAVDSHHLAPCPGRDRVHPAGPALAVAGPSSGPYRAA